MRSNIWRRELKLMKEPIDNFEDVFVTNHHKFNYKWLLFSLCKCEIDKKYSLMQKIQFHLKKTKLKLINSRNLYFNKITFLFFSSLLPERYFSGGTMCFIVQWYWISFIQRKKGILSFSKIFSRMLHNL